jgi:hypothetical protein
MLQFLINRFMMTIPKLELLYVSKFGHYDSLTYQCLITEDTVGKEVGRPLWDLVAVAA